MYRPQAFDVSDVAELTAFMAENNFATLVTGAAGGRLHATHVPVLHKTRTTDGELGALWTHLARANPQSQQLASTAEAMVIFQGPHAYISPSWYESSPAVPTWNYMAVHAYGAPKIVSPEQLDVMLDELTHYHESGRSDPWDGKIPPDFRDKLTRLIVGVEIRLTRVEGVFKLSQNRPQDVSGVIAALSVNGNPTEQALALQMAKAAKQ